MLFDVYIYDVVGFFIPLLHCNRVSYTVQTVKDRQQEARAVLVGSRYIGDYYMILEVQYMYHIPLTTLLYGLSIDIKHVKFTGPETKRA